MRWTHLVAEQFETTRLWVLHPAKQYREHSNIPTIETSGRSACADHPRDLEADVSVKAWMYWGLDEALIGKFGERAHLRSPVERFHLVIKPHPVADEFQGRPRDGFHCHLAMVMVGHSFTAKQVIERSRDAEELPSFEVVLHRIDREAAILQLMAKLDFDRQTATAPAEETVQEFTEGRIPDI